MSITIAQLIDTSGGIETLVPENWLPGALLAAGIALVSLVMLRSWWKRRKRSRRRDAEDAALSPKDRMERVRHQAASANPSGAAVQKLMVEAQELTRACTAQLDSRAAKIERLIEEANTTIERLEAAQRGDPAQPLMRHASGPASDESLSAVGFPMAPQRVHTRREAIDRSRESTSSGLTEDPVADRVMALSRKGLTPVQIAQEMGEQVGRVELMLALRRA